MSKMCLLLQKKKVQFIIDLRFQSDNGVSLEDKISVEDDEIFDLFGIFDEEEQPTLDLCIEPNNTIEDVQQNQVEEAEMIEMVLPIYIEDKEIVLKEDLIENVKLVGEHIERRIGKGKINLIIVCSWKSSSPRRLYKQRKLMKYDFFKVLRKIDEKDNKFELQDDLVLYYKYHPPECIQTRG